MSNHPDIVHPSSAPDSRLPNPDSPSWHVCVTGFITNSTGQVLLVRPPGRGWELPGGRVEPGEGIVEALVREVHEESRCAVRVDRLISVETRVSEPLMLLLTFAGVHLAGDPGASHETEDAGWFSVEEACTLVTAPAPAARLREALTAAIRPTARVYRTDPYTVLDERPI